MKRRFIIGLFVLLALAACHRPVETQNFASLPSTTSPELSAIDSLMWQRPDSALACLLPCFDTCCAAEYDRHYAHLLLSELLYKNDYAQTNRAELQDAVVYFDSLMQAPEPVEGPSKKQNVFLAARAHYINGVGYYEQDSAVSACKEYLKALETMEEGFEEKQLVGKKARFMAYTHNRLGELFSAQFMMEPAITCCEQSLFFCKIAPTSPYGVSNTLYHLGLQYDKLDEIEKAREYYVQALEALPTQQGPIYRDIVASKALCDYQLGLKDTPLDTLRHVLSLAETKNEVLARCITIGNIFLEEGLYDSALVYLEPVFELDKNQTRQVAAANCLRTIYDSLGCKEKSDDCMRFLASQKKSEGQNKALVSQLEGVFQAYLNQKIEKEADAERQKAVEKTASIIIPIAIGLALAVFIVVKWRSWRLLKRQKMEADKTLEEHKKELEAERQTHHMQQAAISGRLKRSNQEVRELKDQIRQQNDSFVKVEPAASFNEEPICRLIMERVSEGQFLSQMDCKIYKDYALSKEQMIALREAVNHHFGMFTFRLSKAYPALTKTDLDYCCLYLLGLTDADIAALMQRAYNTVNERDSKLRRIFGSENAISITLQAMANKSILI